MMVHECVNFFQVLSSVEAFPLVLSICTPFSYTDPQAAVSSLPSSPPTFRTRTNIKWKNDKPEKLNDFSAISSVSHKWHEIGTLLGIEPGPLEAISMKYQKDPEPCCKEVFQKCQKMVLMLSLLQCRQTNYNTILYVCLWV